MKKRSKSAEKSQDSSALPPVAQSPGGAASNKPKRGRPKVSPLDSATQNRLRVQRHREAKRQGEEVQVEIYLPKAWHRWIVETAGANLREVGIEAFALWLKSKGYRVGAVSKGATPSKPS
ncbi:MAG: hypothetical protein INR62_01805 [Rhodospirillales bacterium]|nr:hypothetical protein [Acetobacter sp.]